MMTFPNSEQGLGVMIWKPQSNLQSFAGYIQKTCVHCTHLEICWEIIAIHGKLEYHQLMIGDQAKANAMDFCEWSHHIGGTNIGRVKSLANNKQIVDISTLSICQFS